MEHYKLIVCGGTFDYLHEGHKAFLRFMLGLSDKILLGLTSDRYTHGKTKDFIEPYDVRKKDLETFLIQEKVLDKVVIEPIDDVYIPEQWEKLPIEAIFVSEESRNGADLVNHKREKEGLHQLPIVVFPLVKSVDGGIISSTKIRNGEINHLGRPWIKPLWYEKTLQLTDEQRGKLTDPFGELITDFSRWIGLNKIPAEKLITVGDVITKSCNDLDLKQKVSVIDFLTQRQKTFFNILELGFIGTERIFSITNQSSHIMPEAFRVARQIFSPFQIQERIIVQVSGEEDLVVLPFLLAAPLGFVILYGQPKLGVVKIVVSEQSKEKAYVIVDNFTLI